MQFDIITIFPHIFDSYFQTSILKRAQEKKFIKIKVHDLRFWAKDKHKTVDDTPYGGGPGMILKIEPIYKALKFLDKRGNPVKSQASTGHSAVKSQVPTGHSPVKSLRSHGAQKKQKIILLTPKGQKFNQKMAGQFSKLDKIIFICGRYEGVDARVEKLVDKKVSVGDYVLTGGELPAMIMVDAITRLLPGVINEESLKEESFGLVSQPRGLGAQSANKIKDFERIGEYPQYTRPEVFTYKTKSAKIKKLKVPKVLLSGNHKKIAEWQLGNQVHR